MARISAFQADDPGSNPGPRIFEGNYGRKQRKNKHFEEDSAISR